MQAQGPANQHANQHFQQQLQHEVQQAVDVLQQGRDADAVAMLKATLDRAMPPPQVLGQLGQALMQGGALALARATLDRWWAMEPRNPIPPTMIGSVCYRQRDYEQAAKHYAEAAKRDPKPLRSNALLAESLERLNRLAEAEAAADAALAVDRHDPAANYVLAQVEHRSKRSEAAADRLFEVLAKTDRKPKPRTEVSIRMTLGIVLDALGRYDEAMEQFEQGNTVWLGLPQTQAIDRSAVFERIEAFRAWIDEADVSGWPGNRPEGSPPPPVFFVAFPRSGTTLTEQMLGAHPKLASVDEQPLLASVAKHAASMGRSVPQGLDKLDEPQRAELERVYWAVAKQITGFDAGSSDGAQLIDKLPLNIIQLPLVRRIFPDARVIVALRDPRDCVLSAFMQEFAPNEAMVQTAKLETCARMYAEVMGLWLAYRDRLGLAHIETRYEDLVADPEASMRRLIEFLGLPWDVAVLEGGGTRVANTPSFRAVGGAVHTKAAGRWRRYKAEARAIEPTVAPLIEAFGYER
mgnify:CR=1 FL=1